MHLHILGIAGTFMSGLAILAKEAGFQVTGTDEKVYPPVSDLLREKGIEFEEGYHHVENALKADEVIIGNAIKRGMPVLEAVLNHKKPYTSGPQWVANHILSKFRVIAVAGTHGKTTTTAMLTHILREAGLNPGFLIGGVAPNLKTSAHYGGGEWFVIEADEYDSAFFDKRPKFMHYRPEVAILNNLEYDHADIYPNLDAIMTQFHYLVRTIPQNGSIIVPRDDQNLQQVIERGCYSQLIKLAINGEADWLASLEDESGQRFRVWHGKDDCAQVDWPLIGQFNVENAIAAIAAAHRAGVSVEQSVKALQSFVPIKRRLEVRGEVNHIVVYDDFAHHPTAIAKTIDALAKSKRHQRLFVVMELASFTMRTGVHKEAIGQALAACDKAFILQPEQFDLSHDLSNHPNCVVLERVEQIIEGVAQTVRPGDAVLVMSNRGFMNIHERLLERLGVQHCIAER